MLVDKREQRPLLFPKTLRWYPLRSSSRAHIFKVTTKEARLETGDYLIEEFPSVIVERKGSIGELATNLLGPDWHRAWAAFSRLTEYEHRIIALDFHPASCLSPKKYCPQPDRVLDAFYDVAHRIDASIIWLGECRADTARRRSGEQLLRCMLSKVLRGD